MKFITGPESEAVQMFAQPLSNRTGDWYGEHVGKWLCTAALAWKRTGHDELRTRIEAVVDFLAEQQESSGYLGAYAADAECRFTHPKAHEGRTWDIWNHAWTLAGLLKVAEQMDNPGALAIAEKAARCVMGIPPARIIELGNHQGLSSAVIAEPLAQLSIQTGEREFAEYALSVFKALHDSGVPILQPLNNPEIDVAELGTGKSYQICWLLNGLLTLSEVMEDAALRGIALCWFSQIDSFHVSILGGPWGGIATHKEVFNKRHFFSPDGLTETCSTQMWLRLLRRSRVTCSVDHAFIVRNALLGALDANGHDWCYFTFPNGRRNNTYHWACCKASGALALEEAAAAGIPDPGEPKLTIHQAQDTLDHHGQEIVRREYIAVQYGPYMYAAGMLDGYKKAETICVPQMFPENCFEVTDEGAEDGIPSIRCKPIGRAPFLMRPYFQAGGRHDGAWRTTWLEVAWQ